MRIVKSRIERDSKRKEIPLMRPEERARVKNDKQLINAGWDIVSRNEYVPKSTSAVKEALMRGNIESDYLLFVDDKAIAVIEAKKEENPLEPEVEKQAENYAKARLFLFCSAVDINQSSFIQPEFNEVVRFVVGTGQEIRFIPVPAKAVIEIPDKPHIVYYVSSPGPRIYISEGSLIVHCAWRDRESFTALN